MRRRWAGSSAAGNCRDVEGGDPFPFDDVRLSLLMDKSRGVGDAADGTGTAGVDTEMAGDGRGFWVAGSHG